MGRQEPTAEELPVDPGGLAAAEADVAPAEGTPAGSVGRERRHPLLTVPDFGTAVGAAMLGFEEALRSQPPPEVQAAEHRPIRGLSGQDDDLVLVFPDEQGEGAEDETR